MLFSQKLWCLCLYKFHTCLENPQISRNRFFTLFAELFLQLNCTTILAKSKDSRRTAECDDIFLQDGTILFGNIVKRHCQQLPLTSIKISDSLFRKNNAIFTYSQGLIHQCILIQRKQEIALLIKRTNRLRRNPYFIISVAPFDT